jgi:hypothetical protein
MTGWRFWEPTRAQLRVQLAEARATHAEELAEEKRRTARVSAERNHLRRLYEEARSNQAGASRTITKLLDHARTTPCTKIRLIDQQEAHQFATNLATDTGRDVAEFHAYRCPDCPRRPVTGTRYWHVANSDPSLRTNRSDGKTVRAAKAQRDREVSQAGHMLRQRVTPADIAGLRKRTQEAS